jgi:hypothetical protein
MAWVAVGLGVAGAVEGGISTSSKNSAAAKESALNNAPYLNQMAQGQSLENQPFTPYTGQMIAPESGNEMAAGALAPQIAGQEAPNLAKAGAQWNSGTMQQYMNPYEQAAINVPEQQLGLQYGQDTAALQRKQGMTDAFGIGRSAAQQGALGHNYETEFGNIQQTGMAQAYGAAQSAFQADTGRYAKLASEQGALGSQAIQNLDVTGQNSRSIAQAQDTANYGQFEKGQNWATDQYKAISPIISGNAGHLTDPQPASMLSGILGGAISGVGAGMGMGGGLGGMLGGGGGGVPSGGLTSGQESTMNGALNSNTDAAANTANDDITQMAMMGAAGGYGGGVAP